MEMRALWLPAVLRAAGLTVHEVSGWRFRGADTWGPVRGITCHHTGGSRTSTDAGEIGVLLNGSASAPPPIAQLYLSRTGDWHVVASGLCYHNRIGWDGPNEGYGNDALLGIEAQHSGGDEPWTTRQYDSYVRGVAALVRHKASGWDVAVSRVAGHKEHQPGSKSDPTFNMDTFRARVRLEIDNQEDDMNAAEMIKVLESDAGQEAIARAAGVGVHNQRLGRSEETIGQDLQGDDAVIAARFDRLEGMIAELRTLIAPPPPSVPMSGTH